MPDRFGVPLLRLLEPDVDEVARLLVGYLERQIANVYTPNSWNVRNTRQSKKQRSRGGKASVMR
jgi:hypothetical protein